MYSIHKMYINMHILVDVYILHASKYIRAFNDTGLGVFKGDRHI